MNDSYIRNSTGRLQGRVDGNILQDCTGKIVAKHYAWDNQATVLFGTSHCDEFRSETTDRRRLRTGLASADDFLNQYGRGEVFVSNV